ncbi:AAA family ATPase [Paenibacillus caui]|uniref:AAA family ATPase n=1 Tax=Paenibacillus caui TaxID=2873927 RepID=UPI001CA806E5|nr:AAA family ATPase [Paenibacillus caui]
MILWINGAFGSGKTTISYELHRRLPNSFIYDPEKIGYFIRRNSPKQIVKDDFQDYEIWRTFNYSMLKTIHNDFSGIIIVPMTIVNPQYFYEIIEKLRDDEIEIKHFTLLASHETLLKRLKRRGDGINSWPAQQIERCIRGLTQDLFKFHINTDDLTIEEVVDQIAQEATIKLLPDNQSEIQKKIARLIIKIKHIRI